MNLSHDYVNGEKLIGPAEPNLLVELIVKFIMLELRLMI